MPAKFDRCVDKVTKSGTADNAYAVCHANLGSTKEGDMATDGPSTNGVYGPKAFLDQWFTKVKPKDFRPKGVVMTGPNTEATCTSSLPQMTRGEGGQGSGPHAGTHSAADRDADITRRYNAHNSRTAAITSINNDMKAGRISPFDGMAKIKALPKVETKTISFKAGRFLEAVLPDGSNANTDSKFKVVLLQEGPGNLRDNYYYTRDALASAVPVFEGKKIYADHPTAIQEKIQPERSVRDVLGYFEQVHVEEGPEGQSLLVGTVCIPKDEPFLWARSLMGHSVDFAKKYPDKDLVALSINASGDSNPTNIDDVFKQAPASAQDKLMKAKEQGTQIVNVVTLISDATSCDLVTEAGAGGKILALLEGDMKMAKKENEKEEKKEKKEGVDGATKGNDGVDSDAAMGAPSSDGADAPHDDAGQDEDLFKKMIAKYITADEMASEEEHGMVKQAYEACMEMGMKQGEAEKHAVTHLKMMKHMASKQASAIAAPADAQASPAGPAEDGGTAPMQPQAENEKKEGGIPMDPKKQESNVITLTAKLAKAEQELRGYKVREHVEKMLESSKLPRPVTKQFRSLVSDAKTTEEVDKAFKLFEAGFKGQGTVGAESLFENMIIQPEKTTQASGKRDLFDGIFRK